MVRMWLLGLVVGMWFLSLLVIGNLYYGPLVR
jgi:hypothetical protein